MSTISERLRTSEPGEDWGDVVDKMHEAADTIDALVEKLEKLRKATDVYSDSGGKFDRLKAECDAALAMAREGG